MMNMAAALPLGFALDLLLGDPSWLPHPVVLMGKAIALLENLLRRVFPKTQRGELIAGGVLAVLLPLGVFLLSWVLIGLAGLVHPALAFALQVLWCWQALAAKGLYTESQSVYRCLRRNDLPAARTAVSRIVGRDTASLSAEGVAKAAVETVAENFADGVAAPMLFLALGGAPLGLAYKAVNTMDSMVGYKNKAYMYFGRAAARLDDVVNYLPARLSALLLILAALILGRDGHGAWRIWRRDRRNHASPNSAQTEAACAGALGVRLAGDAVYFGELYHKKTIGDAKRPIEAEDITRAGKLMLLAGALCCAICCAALAGVLIWS